jgi:hypothetical protein
LDAACNAGLAARFAFRTKFPSDIGFLFNHTTASTRVVTARSGESYRQNL